MSTSLYSQPLKIVSSLILLGLLFVLISRVNLDEMMEPGIKYYEASVGPVIHWVGA